MNVNVNAKSVSIAVAVVAGIVFLGFLKGVSVGTDNMKRVVVTSDLKKVKEDVAIDTRDSIVRDSIAKRIAPKIAAADRQKISLDSLHKKTQLIDSTHIAITRTDSVTLHDTTFVAEVPKEVVTRITKDSLAFIDEHELRVSLMKQVYADSTEIKDLKIHVADLTKTVKDLQDLKDKPGVFSDALMGGGTGAIVGAVVGGPPGALIGSGVGLLTGATLHIVFRK